MTTKTRMLPYNRQGEIDYASLSYDPFTPHVPPDAMYQDIPLQEILHIISARFSNLGALVNVFLSAHTILCYDPDDLNKHVSPDLYIAFGVDAWAIRHRHLYLPWEVGKPPDWVLEAASPSTAERDLTVKRDIYAMMGIPEYWRFDATGGDIYGEPLVGERLVNGVYRRIDLTTRPDGVLKAYSPILDLFLCWRSNKLHLYDPASRTYLQNVVQLEETVTQLEETVAQLEETVEQEQMAREAAESASAQERAAREAAESASAQERAAREALEDRNRRLEEKLRRLNPEG